MWASFECSHRLAVRTPDSHSGNTGSIPVGSASSVFYRAGQRRILTLIHLPQGGFFFTPTPASEGNFTQKRRHTGEGRYPMCSYFFGFGGMQWAPTCVGVTQGNNNPTPSLRDTPPRGGGGTPRRRRGTFYPLPPCGAKKQFFSIKRLFS